MNRAILSTIHPITDGADVCVRFNVPRNRISDTTAHAILRIIRELTANAVRHGRASRVIITGEFADGQLLISVNDNGCGFNPASCPCSSTGHFGLDGIRERIDKFNGSITSNPDIAKQLGISLNAVKQHIRAVFTKLGASNRTEAVAIALRRHLLKI